MTEQHAYFMPSGAGIWGPCPAAAVALNVMPSVEGERTRQGTAAHWVGAECLENGHDAPMYMGQKAPNGVVIDNEIIDGADMYINEVRLTAGDLLVERKVHMPDIHPDCWGTVDAAVLTHETLHVYDYKHGFAEVSPVRNKQLSAYTKGVLNGWPVMQSVQRIVFVIVQPFAYHSGGPVRSWECAPADLFPIWDELHASAHSDQRRAVAGVHCRYCPARYRCDVRRETDYRYMDASASPVDFESMDTRSLAIEYELLTEHATLIKSRIEATADELEHRVKNGDASGGFTMASKAGRLEWSKPPAAVQTALQVMGLDARQDGCKTPRQVALSLPAPQRDQFYETIKPLTKRNFPLKLTKSSDTIAGRTFSKRSQ